MLCLDWGEWVHLGCQWVVRAKLISKHIKAWFRLHFKFPIHHYRIYTLAVFWRDHVVLHRQWNSVKTWTSQIFINSSIYTAFELYQEFREKPVSSWIKSFYLDTILSLPCIIPWGITTMANEDSCRRTPFWPLTWWWFGGQLCELEHVIFMIP